MTLERVGLFYEEFQKPDLIGNRDAVYWAVRNAIGGVDILNKSTNFNFGECDPELQREMMRIMLWMNNNDPHRHVIVPSTIQVSDIKNFKALVHEKFDDLSVRQIEFDGISYPLVRVAVGIEPNIEGELYIQPKEGVTDYDRVLLGLQNIYNLRQDIEIMNDRGMVDLNKKEILNKRLKQNLFTDYNDLCTYLDTLLYSVSYNHIRNLDTVVLEKFGNGDLVGWATAHEVYSRLMADRTIQPIPSQKPPVDGRSIAPIINPKTGARCFILPIPKYGKGNELKIDGKKVRTPSIYRMGKNPYKNIFERGLKNVPPEPCFQGNTYCSRYPHCPFARADRVPKSVLADEARQALSSMERMIMGYLDNTNSIIVIG